MKQLRVIVAEDEPIVRKDIIEMLAEGNIITIGECVDGLSAINLTRALKPDLIIMDIKMPGVSGLEAAKTLNQEKIAPVMLLTAYSQQSLIEEARTAGVLAYLVKPVNPQNLIPASATSLWPDTREFGVLHNEIKDLTESD